MNWDNIWSNVKGISPFGLIQFNVIFLNLDKYIGDLSSMSMVLDVGCGQGTTLRYLDNRFPLVMGIDTSKKAIAACVKKGFVENEDVYNMDATDLPFFDRSFHLVFSEGLLEHFKDYTSILDEMCRLSKRYVVIIQPNHYSVFGKTFSLINYSLKHTLYEYSYPINHFVRNFRNNGFSLIKNVPIPILIGLSNLLIFRRTEK